MAQDSQSASPVTNPRASISNLTAIMVGDAVDRRLEYRVQKPNQSPNLIAQGRAARPRATVSNALAATVSEYSPAAGSHRAQSMKLNLRSAPLPEVDKVADAIQRYLNIRPRREATSDPLDEASAARHPQQILQSGQRQAEARYYQFSANGVEQFQFQPEHRAWGGRLELTLGNEGSSGVQARPTASPLADSPGPKAAYDSAFAAQETMSQMLEAASRPKMEIRRVGPPLLNELPCFDPAQAAQKTMAHIQDLLERPERNFLKVGPANQAEDPDQDPTLINEKTMQKVRELMAPSDFEPLKVGYPTLADNARTQPETAWVHTTQTESGLIASPDSVRGGALAYDFRDRYLDQAFLRALRVINELDRIDPGALAFEVRS
ncbi:MAG: hypothetical protein LBP33_07110 [Candidatus Adiutrix sp.]|jgi:hypothetical protein|nr:hypothetical protein [Candidatus Adiutrix sp.]